MHILIYFYHTIAVLPHRKVSIIKVDVPFISTLPT